MNGGEISTIIPTYNRAQLVGRAIESVLRQSYAHCHVIVVDDGSTDDTERVIAERYGNEPRVRYLRQANRGVAAARNVALAAAGGDYVAFLDSDDVWRPWKLELQMALLQRLARDGVGMIWGDMDVVDDAGNIVRPRANRAMYGAYRLFRPEEMLGGASTVGALVPGVTPALAETRVYWGDVYSWIAMGNLCPTPSVLLTRERAAKAGGFDESMRSGEDYGFHLRTCAAGPVAFLDAVTFDYRRGNADQLTEHSYDLTIAQNALRTILDTLEKDRARITLPPEVIRAKLASLHAWIGMQLIEKKDHAAARAHLVSSLRQRSAQPQVWALLAAASLPPSLTEALRRSVRAARRAAARVRRRS